jgi:glycerol-3-phosphate acyltransferase PlsX
LLKESGLNFHGNVEGDDIYKGTTDIVVCDGFVGNVLLKTSEGLATHAGHLPARGIQPQPAQKARCAGRLAGAQGFKKRVDPRRYNGASLLGLRGIVVKSHGSADQLAFAKAIERAAEAARNRLVERISERMAQNAPRMAPQ